MKKLYPRQIWIILISLFLHNLVYSQISLPSQSSFRYLKGSQAAALSSSWMDPGFNDATWGTGNAPFWYGDGSGGTQLTDMQNNYLTLYLRSTFNAVNVATIQEISLDVNFDDGFVIWINGDEVLSQYAPATRAYNDSATGLHESGAFERFTLNTNDMSLIEGTNTIAIQCFNANLTSSDFHFNMSMDATTDIPVLPDSVGLSFSHTSGYYDTPFSLTISSPDAGANIIYTTDGSNPQNSASSITGGTSVTLSVDPSSTFGGRGTTPGFVVRASLVKTGYKPSYPNGRTYIFQAALATQDYPGADWPSGDVWGITTPPGYGAQEIDYPIDPDIINDSRYSSYIEEAFLDIPTLSVITDNTGLFDANTGIYVNAAGHGIQWERACTFELFDPENEEEGFSVNAGIRIRGGWSRHPNFPKHSFRLFFRSEYGESKLRYPLFGDEGTDTYDKIDLRTSQNYGWFQGDDRNTMIREVFSRDMQRDMGNPYTRSRYYHLFLNGMYWGLYQTQERSEARFASDYFGDSAEDYDVVKVSTTGWNYQVEATDGNTLAWERVWNKLQGGFADNEDYFWLEGKDANGNPQPGAERLVEIDNLIDYMIGIMYTGNFDAPTSSFGGNKGPNNFYAIINRNDRDKGFMFFNHDAEHSLFYYSAWPGDGIAENRVNLGDRTDGTRMEVSSFTGFHPQWLHFKLCENDEYRVRFADRAVRFLSDGGELTPEKNRQRIEKRASEMEMAIIAESARWGDFSTGSPMNKNDHWLPQLDEIYNQYIPVRTGITINQLKNADLYPSVEAPLIYRNGSTLKETEYVINPGWIISLENPGTSGTLYYTLDGTDPRELGGAIRSEAIQGDAQNVMTLSGSTIITARIYSSGEWSGLKQIQFFSEQADFSKLKITEIHYHPEDIIEGVDTTSGKNFEFIEFKNTGSTTLNISGVTIDSAVYFKVPNNTLLGPGQFYVVVSKPSKFFDKYAMIGSGNFKGNLKNSGEKILVTDPTGAPIILFTYDDHAPWPETPDGNGPSLVSVEANPTGNPDLPEYWRASYLSGGSPFADDGLISDLDEAITAENDIPELTIYPNPTRNDLNIQISDWNNDRDIILTMHQLDGRSVVRRNISSDLILDLESLNIEPGIYILNLDAGIWSQTRKIIYTR